MSGHDLQLSPPPEEYLGFLAIRTVPPPAPGPAPASAGVWARLTVGDRQGIEDQLDGELAERWRAGDDRLRLQLMPGVPVALGLGDACAKAGLSPAVPPPAEGAPVIARVTWCGDGPGADRLAGALELAGRALQPGQRVGEIRSDHGRRLRVLDAAVPGLDLHACEEDRDALAWIGEHLPQITATALLAPHALPWHNASLDVLLGSDALHVNDAADAARLAADAARVLRRGGTFVLAHRGWSAFAADIAEGRLGDGEATATFRGLYRSGHHVAHTASGPRAYLTLEWLMTVGLDLFALERLERGGGPDGEDVAVLVRR